MGNQVKLSGVVITLNEEENIGRCIKSLKEVCDEILVVDSFSTDRTAEICKEEAVRFVTHEYKSGIDQVTWAVAQASYDHILFLDADEELSPELEREIKAIREDWTYGGYSIRFRTLFCGKWLIHSWRHRVVRLFYRKEVNVAGREPHYNFFCDDKKRIKDINGDVLHHAYYKIEDFVAKLNSYSSRSAVAMFKRGKRAKGYKMFVNPTWNFFRNYILLAGFLDGFHGFAVCAINAHYIFLKYAKLQMMEYKKGNSTK